MVARRIVMILAVMFAALLGAGCAQTVSGTGKVDEAAKALGGADSSDSPSESPSSDSSESSDPSESSSPETSDTDSSSSSSGGGGTGDEDSVCNSLNKQQVEGVFKSTVTF